MEIMTIPGTPIPAALSSRLSNRARHLLEREQITSCEQILVFKNDTLSRLRSCGPKTVQELQLLQQEILDRFPELAPEPEPGSEPEPVWEIPSWSILTKSLADLFRIPPSGPPFKSAEALAKVDAKGGAGGIAFGTRAAVTVQPVLTLVPADLDRLAAVGIPDLSLPALCNLPIASLIEAGISDSALTILLNSLAHEAGLPELSPSSLRLEWLAGHPIFPKTQIAFLGSLPLPVLRHIDLFTSGPAGPSSSTWDDVASITERALIAQLGFNVAALAVLRAFWRLHQHAHRLEYAVRHGVPLAVYGGYQTLVEAYLHLALEPWRRTNEAMHARAIKLAPVRIPLFDQDIVAGTKLARTWDVSRQRVSQVQDQVMALLARPENIGKLDCLWLVVDSLLGSRGGIADADELAVALAKAMAWPAPPSGAALASLFGLSARYRVFQHGPHVIARADYPCLACIEIGPALRQMVVSADDGFGADGGLAFFGAVPVEATLDQMRSFCRAKSCPASATARIGVPFLVTLLNASTGLSFDGAALYAKDVWIPKTDRQNYVLDRIMRSAENGVTLAEVYRQYHKILPRLPIKGRNLYARLAYTKTLYLWGRRTFIHRDVMPLPLELLAEIEQELAARLEDREVPYVCINGSVFEMFRQRLLVKRVPNAEALYSCLRAVCSATLSLPGYPYVRRAGDQSVRLPVPAVLEAYVRGRGEPVSYRQIRKYSISVLCLRPIMALHHFYRTPNLLQVRRGTYIHVDALHLDQNLLVPILETLKEAKLKSAQLYERHHALCEKLGISTHMLLNSVVQHFSPEAMTPVLLAEAASWRRVCAPSPPSQ